MFKSKHSGWTWELRRTPFGPGGIPFLSDLSSSIENASYDAGQWAADNGWMLPVAMATAGAGAYALGADAAAGGLTATEAATTAGSTAYADALAAGASTADATAAGNAAAQSVIDSSIGGSAGGTGLTGGAGGSTGILSGGTTAGLTVPTGAAIAVDPAIAAGTGAGIGSAGAIGGGTVGGLSVGASSGAGSLSSQLAPGTILGTGAPGGGAIGSSYAAGANGLPATDFFGNYIPASSINIGGVPSTVTGTSVTSDTLNTLNNVKKGTDAAKNLSKMLSQGSASGLSSSLGQLAQGQPATALTNAVRGNQNPFAYTAQQPIRDAQPMDLSSLANLLKQG